MQICHGDSNPEALAESYRGGGKEFRHLLVGRDGAPDNYRVVLARQTGHVYTPRHKHNFDQLRYCIEGVINYGKDRWIRPGELTYFPEGTPYGPEECDSDRLGITIQFGGPSGFGFTSDGRMKAGYRELSQVGTFEGGVFRRANGRRNQDAHEAVWEHVHGRRIEYPAPRYDEPVLMRPQNFAWVPVAGAADVSGKALGVFTERRTEIGLLRVEAGAAYKVPKRPGTRAVYVTAGKGSADGAEIRRMTAFEIEAGAIVRLAAEETLELLVLGLPIFATDALAAAA